MRLDDEICFCHHVPLRKLVRFARRERPRHASQMSNCLGAGTGCGWCIPTLKTICEHASHGSEFHEDRAPDALSQTAGEYSEARQAYVKSDKKHTF